MIEDRVYCEFLTDCQTSDVLLYLRKNDAFGLVYNLSLTLLMNA